MQNAAQHNAIRQITEDRTAHDEAFDWHPGSPVRLSFFLQHDDTLRLAIVTPIEQSSHGYPGHLNPPGDIIDNPMNTAPP
jgi:hypothetical protein